MIGLLQRVSQAEVLVDGRVIAHIDRGLLVLVGIERADRATTADRLAQRIACYRVFPDAAGKMNLDVRAIDGRVLLVPQFTLAADTDKGTRASFATAAPPEAARPIFERLVESLKAFLPAVHCGLFGAEMQVRLTNDGPVTFLLRAPA